MAVIAAIVGVGSVWLGLLGSLEWDTPAGPSIVVAALASFVISVLPVPGSRVRHHAPSSTSSDAASKTEDR
jgi:zinc transport system permease protein